MLLDERSPLFSFAARRANAEARREAALRRAAHAVRVQVAVTADRSVRDACALLRRAEELAVGLVSPGGGHAAPVGNPLGSERAVTVARQLLDRLRTVELPARRAAGEDVARSIEGTNVPARPAAASALDPEDVR
jgi:hypothetical protein